MPKVPVGPNAPTTYVTLPGGVRVPGSLGTRFFRQQAGPSRDPVVTIVKQAVKTTALAQPALPGTPGAAGSKTTTTTTIVKTTPSITGKGFDPKGHYYNLDVSFALGDQKHGTGVVKPAGPVKPALTADEKANIGMSYGNPLVNPHGNCVYYVMLKLSQLKPEPLMGGFTLKWIAPPGWKWCDLLKDSYPVQTSSNPLVLIRSVISPPKPAKGTGFQVQVIKAFQY
jgi:hypothetical protein